MYKIQLYHLFPFLPLLPSRCAGIRRYPEVLETWYNILMKNWSTDTNAFTSPEKKRIWELVQGINHGFDGMPVKKTEVKKFWTDIAPHLTTQTRRLWELWLWNRTYSLPITGSFWPQLPKTHI